MHDNVFYSLLQFWIQVVLPRGPLMDCAWRRTVSLQPAGEEVFGLREQY